MTDRPSTAESNRTLALLCAFTSLLIALAALTLGGAVGWVVQGLLVAFLVACAALVGANLARRRPSGR
ncbi:hypothetical protein [Micromonospora mirobrigensis]|uniref:Uncharacterized protein n=1 Tax=Micromonospora mirobrigensis TaxID=262898 RepID=A0A1C4U191_9ACTN|nr:hypothetical protein [Micromonospora mirobrigensis]SCE65471.1 hypothetical protein GA0070564_101150 [Micromonospora mirobrigensis]